MHFMHEPLVVRGADEPMTMYGLLAESLFVAPDRSSVTFRLHPKARFSNGDPVLAADVKYSFECLAGDKADPNWQSNMSPASAAVVLDERTSGSTSRTAATTRSSRSAASCRCSRASGACCPTAATSPSTRSSAEHPITSGPYTIARTEGGRRIEFQRNPDYWGRDIPVRRGMFNFDRVVYRLYQDEDVPVEAFKAGEFDILRAYSARVFARQHKGPKWDDGRIVKAVLPTETVEGLQSYQLNLRRPMFQDIRVREALGLTWDFELSNRYKTFQQADSVFNNSPFAAQGLPGPGELALLEPFRAQLPKEVFGPPYRAPRTNDGPHAVRRNLLKARGLLEAAGWKLAPDGLLRNAQGQAFEFEYLSPGEGGAREIEWARTLRKLGITMRLRKVDYALFSRRLEEFDFDTTTIVEGHYTLPSAQDYITLYGSAAADDKGSNNCAASRAPAVDRILKAMNDADDAAGAARRLPRARPRGDVEPLAGAAAVRRQHHLSHWNKFGKPAQAPRFFTVGVTIDIEPQLAWPELTWWARS